MTLGDFMRYVKRGSGNPSKGDLGDTDVLRAVLESIYIFGITAKPPYLHKRETIVLAPGDYEFELPSDYAVMDQICTDRYNLESMTTNMYYGYTQGQFDLRGEVTSWMESGSSEITKNKLVTVWQAASSETNINMLYIREPVDLTLNDTDEFIDLPREYDNVVLEGARMWLSSTENKVNDAKKRLDLVSYYSDVVKATEQKQPRGRYPLISPVGRMMRWAFRGRGR